jgi:apolipoprotein N-acyltransferase
LGFRSIDFRKLIPPRRFHGLLLASLGGIVFALTSPPTDLYPAVVVGLALLAAAISDAASGWRAFGRGVVWGTSAGVIGLRFVPSVIQRFTPLGTAASYLALVLIALAQSVSWATGASVTSLLRRHLRVPMELAFPAGTLVALCMPTLFAWTPAGLVSPWPAFVQLADLVGERGVSVIIAIVAALLARAAADAVTRAHTSPSRLRAALLPALGGVGIVVAVGAYGVVRLATLKGPLASLPTASVGLVDQSVGPHERWDPDNYPGILKRLRELTKVAEKEGVDLTLWPEAAYPYPLPHDERHAPRGSRAIIGGGVRGPVLFGLITHAEAVMVAPGVFERDSYNSATVVLPDGSLEEPHDKLELLMFGEAVPFGRQLPWLRRIFQRSGGLVPGAAPELLEVRRANEPALRMGVLNCYEDTLPGVGRRVVTALTPNLLVNITNDAWFYGTAESELHARLAAMRAIEHRLDLVRAVNMGVLSWIDARGIVRLRYDGGEPAAFVATPALRDGGLTVYGKLGDAPTFVALGAAIAAVFYRRRRIVNRQGANASKAPRERFKKMSWRPWRLGG